MKQLIVATIIMIHGYSLYAQDTTALSDLLNFVVEGTWTSINADNSDKPEDFKQFYMIFQNWADSQSVRGDIFGVSNQGDTAQLMEVWNYIDHANGNIFLIQRSGWGTSIGTIVPYEGQHMDIQFKTTLSDGRSFYTRDIHYIQGPDAMKAVTYHRSRPEDEWKKASESDWKRN